MPGPAEEPLTGGNVSAGVVRVGSTVRTPATASTPAIEALPEHLAAVGSAHAPRTPGRDGRGRHVLEYVPGIMADTLPPLTRAEVRRVGGVIRALHDAAEGFAPPSGASPVVGR